MITNFEEITENLTESELEIVDILIKIIKNFTYSNPVTSPVLTRHVQSVLKRDDINYKFTEVGLRKMVHYIRVNSLLPIIGTSKGYYVSHDTEEITKQIKSLRERAASTLKCADGLTIILNKLYSV